MSDDRTYCNSKCEFAAQCDRHYTNHLLGDPNRRLWVAEWWTRGKAGKSLAGILNRGRRIKERNDRRSTK